MSYKETKKTQFPKELCSISLVTTLARACQVNYIFRADSLTVYAVSYNLTTFSACGPRLPSVMSNSTS